MHTTTNHKTKIKISDRAKNCSGSAIANLREEVGALLSQGIRILDLSSGDFDPKIEYPGFKQRLHETVDSDYQKYPHKQGILELRANIRDLLIKEGFTGLTIDDICITNGGIQALFNIAFILPDSAVIIPTPFWGPAYNHNRAFNKVILHTHLDKDHQLDLDNINSLLSHNDTSAIYVNSPHNPTGSVFSRKSLEELVAIAAKHDTPLIYDEAYHGLVYDDEVNFSPSEFLDLRNSFLVRSFSKSHSLSGYRLGYVVSRNREYMRYLSEIQLNATSGVNSPTQKALAHIDLEGGIPKVREHYKRKRDILMGLSKVNGFHIDSPPQGAIYLWTQVDIPHGLTIHERDTYGFNLLKSLEVPVIGVPGYHFAPPDCKLYSNYIRLTFSIVPPEELQQVVDMASKKFGLKSNQ